MYLLVAQPVWQQLIFHWEYSRGRETNSRALSMLHCCFVESAEFCGYASVHSTHTHTHNLCDCNSSLRFWIPFFFLLDFELISLLLCLENIKTKTEICSTGNGSDSDREETNTKQMYIIRMPRVWYSSLWLGVAAPVTSGTLPLARRHSFRDCGEYFKGFPFVGRCSVLFAFGCWFVAYCIVGGS